MPRLFRSAILCLCAALTAACAGEPPDVTLSRDERRPPASAVATGREAGTLTIGETGFTLHDEGSGCLAVTISHPGLQATVERHCFAGEYVLDATSSCGWLAIPGEPSPGGCDVDLPRAFYGWVTNPGIGWVCVGTFGPPGQPSTVVSARFVPFDVDGYILDPAGPGESAVAHLFNRGGYRYGQPPLDAPSGFIYEFCEDQAPWKSREPAYVVTLRIELAEPLRRDAVTISLDAGLGRNDLSGGAVESDGTVYFSLEVPESSPGLDLRLTSAESLALETFMPWPADLAAVLEGGGSRTSILLGLTLDAGALDGAADAVALACLTATCRG